MSAPGAAPLRHRALTVALAALPVLATAAGGSLATRPNIPGWYAGLDKPPGTPPNGVFAPAWTLLYCLLAYIAWRLLRLPDGTPGRRTALVWFFVQLALNGAWSWSFFAARNPGLGALNILALLVALGIAADRIRRVDRVAALLLLPYGAWVLYATYLNLGVWRLNG